MAIHATLSFVMFGLLFFPHSVNSALLVDTKTLFDKLAMQYSRNYLHNILGPEYSGRFQVYCNVGQCFSVQNHRQQMLTGSYHSNIAATSRDYSSCLVGEVEFFCSLFSVLSVHCWYLLVMYSIIYRQKQQFCWDCRLHDNQT